MVERSFRRRNDGVNRRSRAEARPVELLTSGSGRGFARPILTPQASVCVRLFHCLNEVRPTFTRRIWLGPELDQPRDLALFNGKE